MRTFLVLALLFLFSRLFFIFAFDISQEVKFGDEKFQGLITYEWIKGPNLPIMDYRGSTYMAGAEKVIALWQIPFFLLFGPNLFALRLASIGWSFLIFLLIYFFVRRHFSGRQAVWASLFFIFSPPSLIIMSLTSIGYHFQSALFVLAFLFLFYEHHFGSLKRSWAFFLEGLILGIGVYFSLQVLIALLAFFLFSLILERRRFFHPSLLFFFLGLGLGYAPGLYEGFSNSFGQFLVYDKPVFEHFSALDLTFKRFLLLFVQFIPQGLHFEKNGFLAPLLSWSWYLLAVFSFCFLFRRGTRRIQLLLLYAALTVLVLVVSKFGLSVYRYLALLLVFFCILLGLYGGEVRGLGQWLRIAGLLICIAGWIPYLAVPQTALAFQEKGFSYATLWSFLSWTKRALGISIQKENLKLLTETAHRSLTPQFLPVFEQVIGTVACYGSKESELARDMAFIDGAEEDIMHRASFYHRWGYCIACNEKEKPDIQTLLNRMEKPPPLLSEALAEGIGDCVFTEKPALKIEPPPGLHNDFYRGAGMAFATLFEEDFAKGVERILQFPAELRPILFEGFGKGTYWWDGGGGEITSTLKEKVPPAYQLYFQKGLAAAAYGGDDNQ